MALSACPKKKASCGNSTDLTLTSTGEKKEMTMSFMPGDSCYITMRAECGVPAIEPKAADSSSSLSDIEISAMSYDDDEVTTESSGTSSVSLAAGSTTTTT